MKRFLVFLLTLFPTWCLANNTDPNLSTEIVRAFTNQLDIWSSNLTNKVVFPLFWTLSLISLSWRTISLALRGADLPDIAQEVFSFIMVTGFWVWYIQNAQTFSNAIIDSFGAAAGIANNATVTLNTKDIFLAAINVPMAIIEGSSGIGGTIIAGICGIVIMISYTYIGLMVMLVYIQNYILMGAGVIVLGLAGSPWTNNYAKNYIVAIFSAGLKLFFILLVVGIGIGFSEKIIKGDINYSQNINIITTTVLTFMIAFLSGQVDSLVSAILNGASATEPSVMSSLKKASSFISAASQNMVGASQLMQASAEAAKNTYENSGSAGAGSNDNSTIDWASKGFQNNFSSMNFGGSSSSSGSSEHRDPSLSLPYKSSISSSGEKPKPMTPNEQRYGKLKTSIAKGFDEAVRTTKATGTFARCMVNGVVAGTLARVHQGTMTPSGNPAASYVNKHFNNKNTDLSKDY